MAAQLKAHEEGYSQVLWLDGVERKYIEEVGAMNIFFKINGKVLTPMLNGSKHTETILLSFYKVICPAAAGYAIFDITIHSHMRIREQLHSDAKWQHSSGDYQRFRYQSLQRMGL